MRTSIKQQKATKAVDGYRWALNEWYGVYKATPQKRCFTDSGAVYFKYLIPKAEFDSIEDRAKFLAAFTPKDWAKE